MEETGKSRRGLKEVKQSGKKGLGREKVTARDEGNWKGIRQLEEENGTGKR